MIPDGIADQVGVQREVVGARLRHHLGAGHAADVAVQGVGRLEGERSATGAAVGEGHALQHLVGTVGGEDPIGGGPLHLGDAGPQGRRSAIRVAIPVHLGQALGQATPESLRRRLGGLVGVQPHGDVQLGRVIARDEGHVVAHLRAVHEPTPRSRIDWAWAVRPSASARAMTCGPTRSRASRSRVTVWCWRRKSSTVRAEENRAVPWVGST